MANRVKRSRLDPVVVPALRRQCRAAPAPFLRSFERPPAPRPLHAEAEPTQKPPEPPSGHRCTADRPHYLEPFQRALLCPPGKLPKAWCSRGLEHEAARKTHHRRERATASEIPGLQIGCPACPNAAAQPYSHAPIYAICGAHTGTSAPIAVCKIRLTPSRQRRRSGSES